MGTTENRDYLTGLYNRKGIIEQFASLQKGSSVHFMFCDLDNFKSVNDVYGHATGDRLLVAVAKLLGECAPEAYVGRLGGDEFIIIIAGDVSRDELAAMADRIISKVRDQRKELQYMLLVSVSIGIVFNESADTDLGQILHKSDAAMYQAKHGGKSCYVFYDDLEEQLQKEKLMESQAEEALENGRFKIFFYPANHLQNSRLERTEVYVRWEQEDGAYWSQEEFRPLLEKNGFIRKVDLYVFQETCRTIPRLRASGQLGTRLSVQLSSLLLLEDDLPDNLKLMMDGNGVSMDEIGISIDETVFANRNCSQVVQAVMRLSEAGFSVGLIHFGQDFSSFRYLRQLRIDSIRFDEGYLKENMRNDRGKQIIKTLIRLGKDLKQLMIADGVADQSEVVFFSGCGCDAASGSYYSELLTEDDYKKYAKERMKHHDQKIEFAFQNNLDSVDGEFTGKIVGNGIRYTDGISDKWGGIFFPGGSTGDNVIKFPERLFSRDSYTIALWIRPDAVWSWGSVVYAGYISGFSSIVPFAGDGITIFRIYEDGDLNGWHDILCHAPELHKWTFITVTYDAFSESTFYYINGKKAGYQVNVPIMYSCHQVILGGDPFQKSYTGSVSAFMVFDVPKTEEQIEALYQSFLEEPGFQGELDPDSV